MNTRHSSNTARRIVGVALLALMLAQFGALLHAVAHGPLASVATAQAHADAAALPSTDEPEAHSAGSPVCQLFDHLLAAQAVGHARLQVPGVQWPTAAPPWVLLPALPHRALQAYDASGPPQA